VPTVFLPASRAEYGLALEALLQAPALDVPAAFTDNADDSCTGSSTPADLRSSADELGFPGMVLFGSRPGALAGLGVLSVIRRIFTSAVRVRTRTWIRGGR
jgi:hypothetical protein